MADSEAIVKEAAAAAKGKKPKLKNVKEPPVDTKAVPLPPKLKKALEAEFGSKLKNVRVHSGGNARDVAKAMKAKAFTIGNDIFVSKPKDAKNEQLLAHELAHVLQVRAGKMPPEKEGKAYTTR